MSEEFKVITTQEEFDKAIQERLRREKELLEKQFEGIKTRNQELETEVGTLNATLKEANEKSGNYDKDIADLNAKIKGYETSNMKTKIALLNGIPYNLAGRLVGEDEASITEDAKQLALLIKQEEPIAPLKNTEPQITKDGAYKSLLENLNLEGE